VYCEFSHEFVLSHVFKRGIERFRLHKAPCGGQPVNPRLDLYSTVRLINVHLLKTRLNDPLSTFSQSEGYTLGWKALRSPGGVMWSRTRASPGQSLGLAVLCSRRFCVYYLHARIVIVHDFQPPAGGLPQVTRCRFSFYLATNSSQQ